MTHLHIILGMPCIAVAFCHVFIVSSPPSLSIDPDTADDVAVYDDDADDQPFSAELPDKQYHFDHHISPTLPSLILALDLPYNCSVSSYSNA